MTTLREWFTQVEPKAGIPEFVVIDEAEPTPWTDVPAEVLDREFDDGYGGSEAVPFVAWTPTHIIFPVVYDGAEWPAYLPRNPTATVARHVGGE